MVGNDDRQSYKYRGRERHVVVCRRYMAISREHVEINRELQIQRCYGHFENHA